MVNFSGKRLGRYTMGERIRREGVADLYLATQDGTGDRVIMKVFHLFTLVGGEPRMLGEFVQAAMRLKELSHPHIMPILDIGTDQHVAFVTMPIAKNGSLEYKLRKGPLGLAEGVHILFQSAVAAGYAHARDVKHCNIRPMDIFIDEQNNVLLADLSLSRTVADIVSSEGALTLTRPDQSGSSLEYVSPEQMMGRPPDNRSDIYALGAVLYETLTGQVPFKEKQYVQLMMKVIQEDPPLPRSIDPGIPSAVETVILKAMAKKPEDRYQTSIEMAESLLKAASSVEED